MRREFPDGPVILGVITYGAEQIARLARRMPLSRIHTSKAVHGCSVPVGINFAAELAS